jgi:hypothetical protein
LILPLSCPHSCWRQPRDLYRREDPYRERTRDTCRTSLHIASGNEHGAQNEKRRKSSPENGNSIILAQPYQSSSCGEAEVRDFRFAENTVYSPSGAIPAGAGRRSMSAALSSSLKKKDTKYVVATIDRSGRMDKV